MKLLWSSLSFFCLHLLSSTAADEFQAPLFETESFRKQPAHRIAIIGAGAAGSSAAYYLRRFVNLADYPTHIDITIFDANPRIGGRTTTVNALDDPEYPVELGASIFVEINHILYNATRDFGLSTKTKAYEPSANSDFDLGIWDGKDFVFTQSSGEGSSWKGWWDVAKLLWKYGMSPIRTQRITKSTVGRFLQFYDAPIFPFVSLQTAVEATGLLDFTGVSGEQTLQSAGVSELFSRDIIQASTRVNYGQNLGGIHGLETLVCMAIDGAMAVEGGNWQIFEQAVKHSHATVHLNTTVTKVNTNHEENAYLIHTDSTTSPSKYDTVILAAPYQFANIAFTPALPHPPSAIPYVSLHVSLFTTPHLLSPSFFNLSSQSAVPSTILTTLPPHLNLSSSARGCDAVGPANFWSISTLRTISSSSTPQYLYKVFSPAPLTGTFLSSLFGFAYTNTTPSDSISDLPSEHITWRHEKHWHSYPYELPRTEFEGFRLDEHSGDRDGGGGIYYTSAIEPFISTMETSALAGMNVARLILDELTNARREPEMERHAE